MNSFNDWWNSISRKLHDSKMFGAEETAVVYRLCEGAWDAEKKPPNQEVTTDALGFTCSNCGYFQKDQELCPKCGQDPSTTEL